MTVPSGEHYNGFKVTVGGLQNNTDVIRTYQDIEKILHANQAPFKTHETTDSMGHFRTYTVET